AFPPEIQRIRSLDVMTSFVMTELDRVADPARLATTNPLSAYTLQPYRKRSAERSFAPSRKNKAAIFLLSCPRAGSTLFRVMLAGERVLVDKSPTYALDLETLARADRYFEAPRYIHLVRHPYTMIESFVRARLDTLLGPNLFKQPEVDPYVVAEMVWANSNRT